MNRAKEERFARGEEKQREREHKRQLCKCNAREKGPSTLGIEMWKLKRVVNCLLPFSGSAICKQTAH